MNNDADLRQIELLQPNILTRVMLTRTLETAQPLLPAPAQPLAASGADPGPLDLDWVTILTAAVIRYPVEAVQPVRQTGRFLQVAYTPLRAVDPELVICLAGGEAGRAFHCAMGGFQLARAVPAGRISDPRAWYERVMDAARNMIGPLWNLDPTIYEADFVLRWLLLCAARGQAISGGRAGRFEDRAGLPKLQTIQFTGKEALDYAFYSSLIEGG